MNLMDRVAIAISLVAVGVGMLSLVTPELDGVTYALSGFNVLWGVIAINLLVRKALRERAARQLAFEKSLARVWLIMRRQERV